MAKLLVSVRDADEAQAALDGGADLIDVKEPRRGALGAPDFDAVAAVAARVAGRRPLSAALGELLEGKQLSAPLGLSYAKLGLAGCADRDDWPRRWEAALGALPPGVAPVAVAYADWQAARAPDPVSIISAAARMGCAALLVDTHDKAAGSLLAHLPPSELARLLDLARRSALLCVVAGGLDVDEFPSVAALAPDYIGVRGAACAGGRTGRIECRRVRRLAELLNACDAAAQPSPS